MLSPFRNSFLLVFTSCCLTVAEHKQRDVAESLSIGYQEAHPISNDLTPTLTSSSNDKGSA